MRLRNSPTVLNWYKFLGYCTKKIAFQAMLLFSSLQKIYLAGAILRITVFLKNKPLPLVQAQLDNRLKNGVDINFVCHLSVLFVGKL